MIFSPRPLTDVDVGLMQEHLQQLGLKQLGKDTAHQAADMVAAENSYHPVRDYLRRLGVGLRRALGQAVWFLLWCRTRTLC